MIVFLITIFLPGVRSGTKPDFKMIRCPLSPPRKDAKPIPKPEYPWQLTMYKRRAKE